MDEDKEIVRYQAREPNRRGARVGNFGQLARIPGHPGLLDRYGISWEESRSRDPGKVLHEDDVQVVVNPYREAPAGRPQP